MSEPPTEEQIPEVSSIRNAGEKFMIQRHFATVNQDMAAEVGTLTVSTTPINTDSYKTMIVDEIEIGYQNYDFGESFISSEMIRDAAAQKDQNVYKMFGLFGDQEPLRTLAWMAHEKGIK